MRVVDTIISREGGNSAWANVVFVGDGGEAVSVRLPCPFPSGGYVARERITRQAMMLLSSVISHDESGRLGANRSAPQTRRFGLPVDPEEPADSSGER